MYNEIKIDISSIIPYAIEGVLALFGRDALTREAQQRLEKQIQLSVMEASSVQCVGMGNPIPIAQIYRPIGLRTSQFTATKEPMKIWELIDNGTDAAIRGGPGAGKTVLLHWTYLNLHNRPDVVPILFTLRWPSAVEDLRTFVEVLASRKLIKTKNKRVVLLVDGYDELDLTDRKKVSESLRHYAALKVGSYYLTCRDFYDIIDLKIPDFYVMPFAIEDALSFIGHFFTAYGVEYDPKMFVDELTEHRLSDFMNNPLMLALICVLRTGPLRGLPRNTIGVIRRAIDTLTFRWDEWKGISREGHVSLDGDERVRCLMRIAYHLEKPVGYEDLVYALASEHVKSLQRSDIEVSRLLREIAQWYGIFIPTSYGEWEFTHRTMHDFLAARFWVESGEFALSNIEKWDTRAAYAACLVPDATRYLERSLQHSDEVHVLTECLLNNALFNTHRVATAVLRYFRRRNTHSYTKMGQNINVTIKHDFLHLVSDEFLNTMLITAISDNMTEEHEVLLTAVLSELRRRGLPVKHQLPASLRDYTFSINGPGLQDVFRLSDMLHP